LILRILVIRIFGNRVALRLVQWAEFGGVLRWLGGLVDVATHGGEAIITDECPSTGGEEDAKTVVMSSCSSGVGIRRKLSLYEHGVADE